MSEEFEPLIPYGHDPQGRPIGIKDAHQRSHYYRCPQCHEVLIVRQGEVRQWHYAHLSSADEAPACDIRTQTGLGQWLKDQQKSPIEKNEKSRRLHFCLIINPYSNELSIFAVLPVPTVDEFQGASKIHEIIQTIQVKGNGIKNIASSEQFHPSEPEAKIELDSTIHDYTISIEADSKLKSICGTWQGSIKEDDIFIGDSTRADRVSGKWQIEYGNVIYFVKKNIEARVPSRQYQLGDLRIFAIEYNIETAPIIKNLIPEIGEIPSIFSTDVILPPETNPCAIGPITGLPKEKSLIAIIPPIDLNPEYEIVTVPYDQNETIMLPRSGIGIPRFFSPSFPSFGSKRISIHYAGYHKLINLSAVGREKEDHHFVPPDVGLLIQTNCNKIECLHPWLNDETMELNIGSSNDDAVFKIIGPQGMDVDIFGDNDANAIVPGLIGEIGIEKDKAGITLSTWIDEGYTFFRINYGPMGEIRIKVNSENKPIPITEVRDRDEPIIPPEEITKIDLSDEEIRRRISQLDRIPDEANWKLMREILEIEEGTPHHLIRGLTLKRLRKILKGMKENAQN